MTYEQAHKFLEVKQREMTINRGLYNEIAIEINGKAIEAVEKQISMEHHHTRITANAYICRESVCPCCLGLILTIKTEYPNYCTWCGQKIDWGTTKKKIQQIIHDEF